MLFKDFEELMYGNNDFCIYPYITENVNDFKSKMADFYAANAWQYYFLETTIKTGSAKVRAAHELIAKNIYLLEECNIIEHSFKRFEYEVKKVGKSIFSSFKVYIVSTTDGTLFCNTYYLKTKTRDIVLSKDKDDSSVAINILENIAKFNYISTNETMLKLSTEKLDISDKGDLEKEWRNLSGNYDLEYNKENYGEGKIHVIKKEPVQIEPIPETIEKKEEVVVTEQDLELPKKVMEEKKRIEELNNKTEFSFTEMKKFIEGKMREIDDFDDDLSDLLNDVVGSTEFEIDDLNKDQVEELYSYFKS